MWGQPPPAVHAARVHRAAGFSFAPLGLVPLFHSLPMACAVGCILSLLRSFCFHTCGRLATRGIGLRVNGAAARYFWAAWTAGGGCPYMSRANFRFPHASCFHSGSLQIRGGKMGCLDAGYFGAGGLAFGFGAGGLVDFDGGRGCVGGNLSDHVGVAAKVDAADVADGGVEGAENEFGALDFDGAAEQRVDDFDERGLDGFLVLKEGGMVDARVRGFDGAEHALVEVAELLSAESGAAARDSGDFDVGASFAI
jgi:hypothetical protein